jgi:hypothetical protein
MATRPQTRHTTLTETAERAAEALHRAGILPHPGVICPTRSRGGARVTVTVEVNRVRLGIAGQGHQEVLLYGPLTRSEVVPPLVREFGGTAVSVRDPHGLWPT